MNPIRVLLADDHTLVRAGLRSLLEGIPGIEVVAEAGDGQETIVLAGKYNPDVVLMDIVMPVLDGLEAAARLTTQYPRTRVLMLSMNASEEYVLQALRSGASGYLLKNVSPSELASAVRAVAEGEIYLDRAVSQQVMAAYVRRVGGESGPHEKLSPRQREVLRLIAEGCSTKEIATRLGIGVKTAETHRQQLMESLRIHDVAGLTRYAIRIGLVSPET